jgi:hypothetical protein
MTKESWYQQRLEAMKSAARSQAQEQAIANEGSANAKVSPLDPDFLLMTLFAITLDGFDAITEILGIALYPKVVGIILDIFTFAIIGFWIYKRTNQIVQSKRQQIEAMQKQIGRRTAAMQKQLAKAAKRPIRRAILRAGIALLGECVWWLGLLPFWTITVVGMLREKGE